MAKAEPRTPTGVKLIAKKERFNLSNINQTIIDHIIEMERGSFTYSQILTGLKFLLVIILFKFVSNK